MKLLKGLTVIVVFWAQTYATEVDTTELKIVEIRRRSSSDFALWDSVWTDTVKSLIFNGQAWVSPKWTYRERDYLVERK